MSNDFSSPEDDASSVVLGTFHQRRLSPAKSTHFVIKFLSFLASCRVKEHIAYTFRLHNVEGIIRDALLAAKLASFGFIVSDEDVEGPIAAKALPFVCVSCNSIADEPHSIDLRSCHRHDCAYLQLLEFSEGECKTEVNHDRLIDHLKFELKTTKVKVAVENLYGYDIICAVLTDQYLRNSSAFLNAGQLDEALMDFLDILMSLNIDPSKLCNGYVGWIESYESGMSRGQSTCDNSKSERFKALVEETRYLLRQDRCKMCYNNKIDYLVLECGHLSFCHACSPSVSWCPICGNDISSLLRVYLP